VGSFFLKKRWEVGHVASRQESERWLVGWLVRAAGWLGLPSPGLPIVSLSLHTHTHTHIYIYIMH
jgi:hypothetical protein